MTESGGVVDSAGLVPAGPSAIPVAIPGRDPRWVVLLVFGVIVLGSMPFYWVRRPWGWNRKGGVTLYSGYQSCTSMAMGSGCHVTHIASHTYVRVPPLGVAFSAASQLWGLGRWSTVYWTVALVGGCSVIVAVGRLCSWPTEVRKRSNLAGVVVLILVAVILISTNPPLSLHAYTVTVFPGDFWFRGTVPLVLIAIFLAIVARVMGNWPFALFAAGYLVLAILTCLYDIENVLYRMGLPVRTGYQAEPNIVLPGLYLLVGGIAFWWLERRAIVRAPTG